jgi:hypothetical protein
MDSILNTLTVAGLQKVKGQLRQIAEEADVDYSWLNKYGRGVFPDPSVRRVERVYRVLVRRGLVEPVITFNDDPPLKACA